MEWFRKLFSFYCCSFIFFLLTLTRRVWNLTNSSLIMIVSLSNIVLGFYIIVIWVLCLSSWLCFCISVVSLYFLLITFEVDIQLCLEECYYICGWYSMIVFRVLLGCLELLEHLQFNTKFMCQYILKIFSNVNLTNAIHCVKFGTKYSIM